MDSIAVLKKGLKTPKDVLHLVSATLLEYRTKKLTTPEAQVIVRGAGVAIKALDVDARLGAFEQQ